MPEDEELGRTQVVEPEQETYEVPDDGAQDTVIQRQEQPLCETYEVPGPEPEQETYELPEEPGTTIIYSSSSRMLNTTMPIVINFDSSYLWFQCVYLFCPYCMYHKFVL